MDIHFRVNDSNKEHTRFTTFIDGKNCGDLCMGTDDFVSYQQIMYLAINTFCKNIDTFKLTGIIYSSSEN